MPRAAPARPTRSARRGSARSPQIVRRRERRMRGDERLRRSRRPRRTRCFATSASAFAEASANPGGRAAGRIGDGLRSFGVRLLGVRGAIAGEQRLDFRLQRPAAGRIALEPLRAQGQRSGLGQPCAPFRRVASRARDRAPRRRSRAAGRNSFGDAAAGGRRTLATASDNGSASVSCMRMARASDGASSGLTAAAGGGERRPRRGVVARPPERRGARGVSHDRRRIHRDVLPRRGRPLDGRSSSSSS